MKTNFLLFLLASIALTFSSCTKEDLTVEIVGDYIGGYSNFSISAIDNYEIVITKKSNDEVVVKPKSGTEFEEFTFELTKANETTITSAETSASGVTSKSGTWTLGPQVGFTMSVEPINEGHVFNGTKQ